MSGVLEVAPPVIDLKPFCHYGRGRLELSRPWTAGNFTYASDGRVAIRTRVYVGVQPLNDGPHARIDKWLCEADGATVVPLPTVQIPIAERTDCEKCNGSGFEHECPDCRCECRECDGRGFEEQQVAVKWGGDHILAATWQRIAALPSARIANAKNSNEHFLFRFDGGSGLCLPIRRLDANAAVAVPVATS